MQEIEVKILEINKTAIEEKLLRLGAEKIFDGSVVAAYYDFGNNALTKKKKTLRLRKKGQFAELTLKEHVSKGKAKIMNEYEIPVTDYAGMKRILEGIGLQEHSSILKTRTSYQLGQVHFDIDTLPDIPTFVEVEAPDMNSLEYHVKLLGYSMKDAKPWSGKDVLEYYEKSS